MVYVRILFVGLIASLCEVTLGASMQRCRPCQAVPAQPRIVPPVAVSCAKGYERTLEDIISRLVNALIYTSIQNSRAGGGGSEATGGSSGSGTGGSGTGGSNKSLLDALIALNVGLGDTDLLDLEVLPGSIRSGTGGGTSGGSGSGSSGGTSASGTGSGTGSNGSSGSPLLQALLDLQVALNGSDVVDLGVLRGTVQ